MTSPSTSSVDASASAIDPVLEAAPVARPRAPSVPPPSPPATPSWRSVGFWVQFLGGALIGGGGTVLAIAWVREAGGEVGLVAMLSVLVGLMLGWWPQMLVHEAGHAVAGRIGGFELVAMAVGRWRGERGGDGWRFRRRPEERGVGGFALMLPRGERTPRWGHALYMLGGPLANLLAAAALLALAGPADAALGAWAGGLVLGVAAAGALLGLVNLVPFTSGGWSTDGRQLLALLRGRAEARLTAELLRVSGWAMLGRRPRDWPALDLRGADDPALPGPIVDALLRLTITRVLDGPEAGWAAAQPEVDRLAERLRQGPDGLRPVTAVMLAAWSIKACRDADAAEAWLAETAGGVMDLEAQRHWLRAAIDAERGDHAAARAGLARARQALPRQLDGASRAMLVEELDALEARLVAAAAA